MKVLLLDNYDSFTFNLLHLAEQFEGTQVEVVRNDQISLGDVKKYHKIILSPGPGLPKQAGITMELIRHFAPSRSILGVCLGHQAIAEAFGGTLLNLSKVQHGVSTRTKIIEPSEKIFRKIPGYFNTGRYHSWAVSKEDLPACLSITAEDEKGNIMALRHNEFDVCGIQFHPESVLTEYGQALMNNWLSE